MPAIRAAHAGEALVQVAAAEKGRDRPLVVGPLKGLEVPVHQPLQVGKPLPVRARLQFRPFPMKTAL
jgi:hypothetical protein